MSNDKEFLTAQELKDRICSNDNRCTAKPYLLLLNQKRKIVVDGDYGGTKKYVENHSGDYVTDDTEQGLIKQIRENCYSPDEDEYNWSDKQIKDHWQITSFYEDEYEQTVNVFLTDKGYEDHKRVNGHNLQSTTTFGIHAFRNREVKSLFNLIDENIEQQKIIDKKNEEIWDLKQELSDAEEYIKNIETVSTMWMNDYDALKNKYEPEILQQSEVESE